MSTPRASLSATIRLAFLALGLAAIVLTGLLSLRAASNALESAGFERLTGWREARKRQVELYFRDVVRNARALALDESTVDALLGFEAAGASPDGAGEYDAVREIYHRGLAAYRETFDFDDLLLISGSEATVVYSTAAGSEVGLALTSPQLAGTSLERAYRRAATAEPAEVVVEDYAAYPPDRGAPAAFAAVPVFAGEARIGVLAVRLSNRKIDEVMTGGGNWRNEGLGVSGETYLVGPDRRMRSDSRFQIEDPAGYSRQLLESGYDPETVERIRNSNTSILMQQADTAAVRAALAGESGVERIVDYRGVDVLSSYTPLDLPGLDWVLLSEIDVDEAFAPTRALRNTFSVLGLFVAGAFLLAGTAVARRAAAPLSELTADVARIQREGLHAPVDLDRFGDAPSEIAALAQGFQGLRDTLQNTLVSRDRLDDLLASMINAVFLIGAGERLTVVRAANPAACRLLRLPERELIGRPARDILGSKTARPDWYEELAAGNPPVALEKELVAGDGSRISVLFTAAYLRGSKEAEVVCVAQDVSAWRETQRQLRARRQELRSLARRLIEAQEDERARLARDLHDDVTQRLGLLAIEAGKLRRADGLPQEARDRLQALQEDAITLSQDVQRLSRSLHPSLLSDLGLGSALRAECERVGGRLGIPVSCAAEDVAGMLGREETLALYRIAQEALNNVVKHSGASEVDVELDVRQSGIRLTVSDNGRGFDATGVRGRGGLGLVGMEERARLAGGTLSVVSAPGAGAKIQVEIPMKESADGESADTGGR